MLAGFLRLGFFLTSSALTSSTLTSVFLALDFISLAVTVASATFSTTFSTTFSDFSTNLSSISLVGSTTLEVSKNRNSRSSTINGTYFKLTLTNVSVIADTYDLTYINNSNTCSSGTENQIGNVNLNIQFENLNFNSLSKIALQPNESIEFYAHIIIPLGTPINKWCCSEIIATSNNCSSYQIITDIHTLVITTNNE